jgi:uncharacterized membrane protein (DUF4010 family)
MAHAAAFAALVAGVLLGVAAMTHWLGARGTLLATALAGLADAHAAAASAAALVAAGRLPVEAGVWPVLLGVSSNTLMKAAVAWWSGGSAFALRLVPGLALMLAALWLGAWWT